MYLGYALLHDTEIWNNQRVLDYLAGDPDNGVAGMAPSYSTVNRKSSCSNALPLICDQPVDLVPLTFTFATSRASGTVMNCTISAMSLDGVEQDFLEFPEATIRYYIYTLDDTDQARPATPSPLATAWVEEPLTSGPISLPFSFTPGSEALTEPPLFGEVRVSVPDLADSVLLYFYADSLGTDSLTKWSFDGGETWASSGTATLMVDSGLGTRYTTPAQDDAPWYDALVPASAQFAGLYVEEVTGFDALSKRDVNDSALTGGTLGPLNFTTRSMTVTGWLRGSTCTGTEYGLQWLTEALMGNTACVGGTMGDLIMFKCCPTELPVTDEEITAAIFEHSRSMYNVGLVDGPKVVDRVGTCCGSCGFTALKVQFTITSESPYIFSEAEWILYEDPFEAGDRHRTFTRSAPGMTGTVTLEYGDSTSSTLSVTSGGFTAANLVTAIESLPEIPNGVVSVTGSAGGPLELTWEMGSGMDVDDAISGFTINNAGATGGTLTSFTHPFEYDLSRPCRLADCGDCFNITDDKTDWTFVPSGPGVDESGLSCGVWYKPTGGIGGYAESDTSTVWNSERCVRGNTAFSWTPDCGSAHAEPPAPFIISDECYCEPWETYRLRGETVNSNQWNDVTTYIEIQAGSKPPDDHGNTDIHDIKIVGFMNPRNIDCPVDYEKMDEWTCEKPCASIAISSIPSGSTLVIDSRLKTITLTLAGGKQVPGLPYVSSGENQVPFEWFDVGACTRLCIISSVEAASAPYVTMSLGLVNRFVASGG